jgi:hypothetical protein
MQNELPEQFNPQQRLESFNPPDWHLRELERRVAAADADPDAAERWETVLARLLRKP